MAIVDLSQLAAPDVVEEVDYETLLAERKATFVSLYPEEEREAIARTLTLESEPIVKLLQENAYREVMWRQRVNEALANLHARGLIDVEYGGLRVPDVQALRTWCCQPHGANSSK